MSILRCRVGAKMPAFKLSIKRGKGPRRVVHLVGGPFDGETLSVTPATQTSSLQFRIRNAIGRYVSGVWVALDSTITNVKEAA